MAQVQSRGFRKDSLQIKAKTEIHYKGYTVDTILVSKIYCDYCDARQMKYLREEAYEATAQGSDRSLNIVNNNISRITLFIRVSKEEFKKLKKQ